MVDGDVHVIQFCLDAEADAEHLASMLDAAERARANALVLDPDRRRFLVAHATTRTIVGEYLGLSPAAVRFSSGRRGKPAIAGAPIDLRINLSHAGERGLLAVALGREVGVDIERERPVDALNIARRYFSPAEYHALASVPPDQRVGAFFRCWTRKESYLKACGDGLSHPLNQITVSLEETAAPLPITSPGVDPGQWTMLAVPVDAGYTAAITAAGRGWRMSSQNATLSFR